MKLLNTHLLSAMILSMSEGLFTSPAVTVTLSGAGGGLAAGDDAFDAHAELTVESREPVAESLDPTAESRDPKR